MLPALRTDDTVRKVLGTCSCSTSHMPCGAWWVPGGQTGDGASAQSRECVAGAPSVQPRLFLVVPLGRADLPGSRIDPTHLGVRASCPDDQPSTVGLPVFTPSWLVSDRNKLSRKSAEPTRAADEGWLYWVLGQLWIQTYLLGIELWQDILKMSQLIRYMDWDDP